MFQEYYTDDLKDEGKWTCFINLAATVPVSNISLLNSCK